MWLKSEILHSDDRGGAREGGEPLIWQQRKHTNCKTANWLGCCLAISRPLTTTASVLRIWVTSRERADTFQSRRLHPAAPFCSNTKLDYDGMGFLVRPPGCTGGTGAAERMMTCLRGDNNSKEWEQSPEVNPRREDGGCLRQKAD